MNVLVLTELDDTQLADLSALLQRCQEADDHPALAEPQRVAAARHDLGADGARLVLVYEGATLIGCAFITPALDGAAALHLAVDPSHRSSPIKTALLRTALPYAEDAGTVRLWLMKATDSDDAEAAAFGFVPERDLVQMRIALPLSAAIVAATRPVITRPFRPGRDDEAWLDSNNRAFADHPEQGGWTRDDLLERMAAPWFDPEGFLMADADDGTGALLGSCWTKVDRDTDPVLGEIYVISVNPAYQGGGWGRALTVAGLQWMAGQGITLGMLYTTASNTAAVTLYQHLGFSVDHVDRSYTLRTDVLHPTPVPIPRPTP